MNKTEFEQKRVAMLASVDNLLKESKADEANEKMQEIKNLDAEYDKSVKAQAELEILKGVKVANPMSTDNKIDLTKTVTDTIDYQTVFAKVMLGREITSDERKVYEINNAVTTKSGNGAVIPETLIEEIIKDLGETHPVLQDVRILNIKGNVTLPKAAVTANANWYDDGTTTSDGSVSTAEINLYGYDLKCNIDLSFNMKEMSIKSFITFLTAELKEQMSNKLANGIVNGLGIPGVGDTFKAQPTGIVGVLEAETDTPRVVTYTTSNTSAELEAKIREMLGKLKSGYKSGAAIYAKSATIWGMLAGIKDSNGRAYFVAEPVNGGVGRIFGVPVKEEDAIPTDAVLLGNFKNGYVVNFNKDITILSQDINKDVKTTYTGYAIVDGKPRQNEAFVYLKKS